MFLTNERCDDVKLLASDEWCARLAYMAGVFQHLNELNTWMQGRNENLQIRIKKWIPFKGAALATTRGKYQPWHVHSHQNGKVSVLAALCETIGKHFENS